MIPKIIHYCWFGGNSLPKSAVRCIASWRKFLPDYEIKEWNESNFDVNRTKYTEEAYKARKYAYVSDYARFWVLYHYGGIYFDVDVEIIKNLDDIISQGPFLGAESTSSDLTEYRVFGLEVNPGLGLGVPKNFKFVKKMLDHYERISFDEENKNRDAGIYMTVVGYTTNMLVELGMKNTNEIQCVDGIYIYPKDYFNPLEHINQLYITENTRSIHWYDGTWQPRRYKIYRRFVRLIGPKVYALILAIRNLIKS